MTPLRWREAWRRARAGLGGFALAGRSRFARNVLQVARANVLAQALPVLAAPLLTRLYAPQDFGALALFASILGVALAVGTARFEWSVPNARSRVLAAALVRWGAVCLLVTAGVLALAWAGWRWAVPQAPAGAWSLLHAGGWTLVLALVGAGAQQLLQGWHVRGAELSAVARAKVTQSLANVGMSVLAAALGAWGLVTGVLVGAWVGLATLWRRATGLPQALARTGPLRSARSAVAWRRFRGEAAWSTLASALNTASFAVVPLLLARHHGAAEVGFYALMQRVALAPIGLVGSAVSQSFWAEAARLVRSDVPALARLYRTSLGRLAWVALPLALVALAGPLYIGPLFGAAAWQPAGWVLAASVPMLIGQVVASPLSHLVIHRKQRWQALWDAARIAALVLTIEMMGHGGAGITATVLALSLVMGVMYIVLVVLNLRALRQAGRAGVEPR